MRSPKKLALSVALLTAAAAFAAPPVPAGNSEPFPTLPLTPEMAPAAAPEKVPPPAEALPRPDAAPSLLPEEIPAATKRPASARPPVPGKPGTSLKPQATAANLDLRIRYRKARNIAEANAKVRAAWEVSRDAKTDQGKRQALRRYYDLLFSQMLAVDRSIAPLVEGRRKAEAGALTQTLVAPTVPAE